MCIPAVMELGFVPGHGMLRARFGLPLPKHVSRGPGVFRFGGNGYEWFYQQLSEVTGMPLNKYYRNPSQRQQARNAMLLILSQRYNKDFNQHDHN